MTTLHEQYRPHSFDEVVGQDKIIAKIRRLARRGLAGRGYWISGQSGTGKTTIARLIAAEVASEWSTEEQDAQALTPARLRDLEQSMATLGIGEKTGRAYIVNEAHGLSKAAVRQLLVLFDRLPSHVVWIFTTTCAAQKIMFERMEDGGPLLSRCACLELAQDVIALLAIRARWIARQEGLDGRPVDDYIRLVKRHQSNMRAVLQAIEVGEMLDNESEEPKEITP